MLISKESNETEDIYMYTENVGRSLMIEREQTKKTALNRTAPLVVNTLGFSKKLRVDVVRAVALIMIQGKK